MSSISPRAPFDTLVELLPAHRVRLVGVARAEGVGAEDAVEIVQDACLTALALANRGGAPDAIAEWPAWLTTIARNAARNRRRRHHVAKAHEPLDDAVVDDGDTIEAVVARAEEHVRLRACLEGLCGTQRAVVTLRLLEERDGEDVARALGIRRGHVDVLLHRAKAALRSCLVSVSFEGTEGPH